MAKDKKVNVPVNYCRARKLMGDNLKVVWAVFSTLS
jgi:hypothetical protein